MTATHELRDPSALETGSAATDRGVQGAGGDPRRRRLLLAGGLATAGFAVLVAAWATATSADLLSDQLTYMAGSVIGLFVVGVAALLVVGDALLEQHDQTTELEELTATLVGRGEPPPAHHAARSIWASLPISRRRRLAGAATLAAVGAVLVVAGWFAVSGTREWGSQLSRLAGPSVWGIGLLAVGAAVLLADVVIEQANRLEALRGRLEAAIVLDREVQTLRQSGATGATNVTGLVSDAAVVTLPGLARYHSPACHLVAGKRAETLSEDEAEARGLSACLLCRPK